MMYTVSSCYFATGEGQTAMILYTHAKDAEDAKTKFADKFGGWFAHGCEVKEGLDFDGYEARLLVSERARSLISADAGGKEFYASLYVNFS